MNAQLQLIEGLHSEIQERPVSVMRESMTELMNEFGLNLSDIARATKTPLSTLFDWYWGNSLPVMGPDILAVATYLKTSTDYLCFGIGQEHPYGK